MAGKKKTQQDAAKSTTEKSGVAEPKKGPVSKKVSAEFSLEAPLAKKVSVAGTFNGWDVKASKLKKDVSGVWTGSLCLDTGCYEYRFCVDGSWINDVHAKGEIRNAFGTFNSIVEVI